MINTQCRTMTETSMTCGCCGEPSPALAIWAGDDKIICYGCYVSEYGVCSHCGRLLPNTALVADGRGGCACNECMELIAYEKEEN